MSIDGEDIPTPHGWFIPGPSEKLLEGLAVLEPRSMYDQCIVGVVRRFNDTFVLYDEQCIIDQLVAEDPDDPSLPYGEGDAHSRAVEWYEFNIVGGWIGESTPGFLLRDEDV
jgi:hypothetical protein